VGPQVLCRRARWLWGVGWGWQNCGYAATRGLYVSTCGGRVWSRSSPHQRVARRWRGWSPTPSRSPSGSTRPLAAASYSRTL